MSKQRVVLLKNERVEIIESFVLVLVLVLVKIERGANGKWRSITRSNGCVKRLI